MRTDPVKQVRINRTIAEEFEGLALALHHMPPREAYERVLTDWIATQTGERPHLARRRAAPPK